jgi:hypothetical protein
VDVDETLILFRVPLRWSCNDILLTVGYPPTELSDTRKPSQSSRRSMRLVESKPRMNHQMHMMRGLADWICYRVEKVAETCCSVKQP